jgi:histidine triad (HIT) family protein
MQSPEQLLDLMQLGCKIAENMTEGSFRFTFNTGAEAGQTVFHAHGHILSKAPKH